MVQFFSAGFWLNRFLFFLVLIFLSPTLHQQEVIRNTVEDRLKIEAERKQQKEKAAALASRKTALDRFKK